MRQGRRDVAIKMYEGAVKANPRHIRSHFNKGMFLQKRLNVSSESLKVLIFASNPGVMHEESGQYTEAEECFTDIIQLGTAGRLLEALTFHSFCPRLIFSVMC